MRKRERLAGSKAYRLRFEAEKPKPPSMLRHTESAADALSDVLEVVLLVMGTPSTTNRAVPPFMLMDVSPRRVTRIDPPGPVDA